MFNSFRWDFNPPLKRVFFLTPSTFRLNISCPRHWYDSRPRYFLGWEFLVNEYNNYFCNFLKFVTFSLWIHCIISELLVGVYANRLIIESTFSQYKNLWISLRISIFYNFFLNSIITKFSELKLVTIKIQDCHNDSKNKCKNSWDVPCSVLFKMVVLICMIRVTLERKWDNANMCQ